VVRRFGLGGRFPDSSTKIYAGAITEGNCASLVIGLGQVERGGHVVDRKFEHVSFGRTALEVEGQSAGFEFEHPIRIEDEREAENPVIERSSRS
jgi:hypothetical protein